MSRHLKHASTDEVLQAIEDLVAIEAALIGRLRTYKQDDSLAEVVAARETAIRLREATAELARDVAALVDREIATRAIHAQRTSPAVPASVAVLHG